MNSTVRLGISPNATTLTDFFSQRFWGLIFPWCDPGLLGLSGSPVVPPGLPACKSGTTSSTSHCLAASPLGPGCPSLPLLLFWMNVFSLTPWLLDFHGVQFSVSSCWFLFLNLLLSFFWLCKEAQCVYLHFRLGWKSYRLILKARFTYGCPWWSGKNY